MRFVFQVKPEGTLLSLRSRRRKNSYLSVELDGPDTIKLVHAGPNGTQRIIIPAPLGDGKWHQLALGWTISLKYISISISSCELLVLIHRQCFLVSSWAIIELDSLCCIYFCLSKYDFRLRIRQKCTIRLTLKRSVKWVASISEAGLIGKQTIDKRYTKPNI